MTKLLKRPTMTPGWLTVLAAWFFITLTNVPFWKLAAHAIGTDNTHDLLFLVALYILLITWLNQALSLLLWPWTLKVFLVILLLGSAGAAYFMTTYGIMIDREMIQNMLMTDSGEAADLLSLRLVLYVVILGIIPVILVLSSRVHYPGVMKLLLHKVLTLVITAVITAAVASVYYADLASFARNNTVIRHLIVPFNYVAAIESYINKSLLGTHQTVTPLGTDAHKGAKLLNTADQKKVLTVIVVGEAARAQDFSLNGYTHLTNPELSKQDIVNFPHATSCGTETAVSVPCMFSHFTRVEYTDRKGKNTENLLDVLHHAGIDILWRDNNSSSRGVAARLGEINMQNMKIPGICQDGECFDDILLYQLQDFIDKLNGDAVIVLHQKGSHGPAYYKRSPAAYKKFMPECRSNQLQDCSREELINAYDNTIVYTDHVVSEIINLLKKNENRFNTAMWYLADHGESTGEKGIYLHATPYMFAPEEQTHIGMVQWFSPGFLARMKIDKSCVEQRAKQPVSQDNLYDSVLGMMNIQTSDYNPQLDLFKTCSQP
jgi:lipid A ethanolaminephosphotransferase